MKRNILVFNLFFSFSDPIVLLSRCVLRPTIVDSFNLSENLRISENNRSKAKKINCNLCNKFYSTSVALGRHRREVHDKEKSACNICDYKTAYKSCLQRHKLTHSAKVECLICKKRVASMDSHLRAHKPKDSCKICQRGITKRHMNQHLRVHTRRQRGLPEWERRMSAFIVCSDHNQLTFFCYLVVKVLCRDGPFICDKCGSKHYNRKGIRQHISRKHRTAPVSCDLCLKIFNQKRFLVLHMKRVHLKLLPFKCKACRFRSFTRIDLKQHMLQHGPKTMCKTCHKFVANIVRHLKCHVKEECRICGKIYRKRNFRKHIESHRNSN